MDILTIILFFVYAYGFGYSITKFLKNSDNFLERNLMRIGIGLGVIPSLGIFLGVLHLPIDWKIFLFLSIIIPCVDIYNFLSSSKKFTFNSKEFKLSKSNIYILIVLLLFFLTLFMYLKGAFAIPWLEDDDTWHHASSIKFISTEKSIIAPLDTFMYLNPYPPGYDLTLAILHQTSPSLMWVMKFFNTLLISLGIIFFYFFAKRFTGNNDKALFATFILAAIPCYLSHFIWAHGFFMTLFFVAMYAVEMLKDDEKWMWVSIITIASMCFMQPTKPIKFLFIFASYFTIKWISSKKFDIKLLAALFGGYLVSIIWWFNHWKDMISAGSGGAVTQIALQNSSFLTKMWVTFQKAFPPNSGSATRAYTFDDIFFAHPQNMINNPIGIGVVISILILLGIIFIFINHKKLFDAENNFKIIIFLWLVYTFLGFNTMTFHLPIGLFAFRFWMIFAIPAAFVATEGLWFLFSLCKKYHLPTMIILIAVVIGVITTSAQQKYEVNTVMWPFGIGWSSQDELQGYLWMKDNLPVDTKVFTYSANFMVFGLDMYSCIWCEKEQDFRNSAFNQTPQSLSIWMKNNNYDYFVIGGIQAKQFGFNETNIKIKEIANSGLFSLAHQTQGVLILKRV